MTLLGHIIEFEPPPGFELTTSGVITATVVVFAAALTIEHLVVKHGVDAIRHLRRYVAIALFGTLVIGFAPTRAIGQDETLPAGLPDLISDPPVIWFDKVVEYPDGTQRKVIAFDGFLHNIGEGMLDLEGNPQIEGGVRQRVWDGEQWNEVGSPEVLYEVTDGHNHFHLMDAADYSLWDEAQRVQIGESAKVGFCLVDSDRGEERYEKFYDINHPEFLYCQQYNPDATNLRMGITPGWIDQYDANTTLQWVDVSNTAPGRYWVGAIMDPSDQIVESNEENNALVWSTSSFAVTGYAARPLPRQSAGDPIRLRADVYGMVGDLVWKITDGPEHGALSVPVGVDFTTDTITYHPEPGFDGIDSFTYLAADVDSDYPLEPREITVEVDASTAGASDRAPAPAPAPARADLVLPDRIDTSFFREVEATAAVTGADAAEIEWYADGLPGGLRIDLDTGEIGGIGNVISEGVATIVAVVDGAEIRGEIPWRVTEAEQPSMAPVSDFTVGTDEGLRFRFGLATRGATYTGVGLPEGANIVENLPLLAGRATEMGTFDIEVIETFEGVETGRISFTMTVRPTARPAFPL